MYYYNTPVLARLHAKAMKSSDNYHSAPVVVTNDEYFKDDKQDS